MRVGVGVAVPGEVLGHGQHSVVLQALDVLNAQRCHAILVFAKRAVADDRVAGVGVHVEHWREIDVYTQSAHFAGDVAAHLVHVLGVVHGAQRHLLGEVGRRVEAHVEAPFGIHGHEQRHFGGGLQAVGHDGLAARAALHKHHAANIIVAHQPLHALDVAAVLVGIRGHHEELAQALVGRERVEHAVDPGRLNRAGGQRVGGHFFEVGKRQQQARHQHQSGYAELEGNAHQPRRVGGLSQGANGPRGPYFCREVLRNPPGGFRGSEADGGRRYSVVGKRVKQQPPPRLTP